MSQGPIEAALRRIQERGPMVGYQGICANLAHEMGSSFAPDGWLAAQFQALGRDCNYPVGDTETSRALYWRAYDLWHDDPHDPSEVNAYRRERWELLHTLIARAQEQGV